MPSVAAAAAAATDEKKAGSQSVEVRSDGRNPNQLRPLLCTRGLLERAHGSARWAQGNSIFAPSDSAAKFD